MKHSILSIIIYLLSIGSIAAQKVDSTLYRIANPRAFEMIEKKSLPESEMLASEPEVITSNKTITQIFISKGIAAKDYQTVKNIRWEKVYWRSPFKRFLDIDLNQLYDYNALRKIILSLSEVRHFNVLSSSMQSTDGRDIFAIEIGTGTEIVLISAGVHGREVANPLYCIKYACYIANEIEKGNQEIINYLKNRKIVILPCINPDGYDYAQADVCKINYKCLYAASLSRKNLNRIKANANGVDINRNFPNYSAEVLWYGELFSKLREDEPSYAYYGGETMGSENETKVAMSFLERYIPKAIRYVDIHSAGHCIYAGKPHLSDEFNTLSQDFGKQIKAITRYALYGLNKEKTGYGVDGSITDYAAELAAGFVYNESLERIAPKQLTDSVITKTEDFIYKLPILTVETLVVPKSGGLITCSTPKMHAEEWEKRKLADMFFHICFK